MAIVRSPSTDRLTGGALGGIDFAAVRTALDVPVDFPADVLAEAERVAADPAVPVGTEDLPGVRADRTDIPFVTIDPPGSMDLDQAMHLERSDAGFTVRYAIADVAAFVAAGSPIDIEAHRRGQTLYCPDENAPLHPRRLSEGAASLLPDRRRPAVLWTIELDAAGNTLRAGLERALVRSVARLDYAGVQADAVAGRLHPSVAALPEIGELRRRAARARHAIALNLPDAEVTRSAGGHWTLELRAVSPLEDANAEISLLTGMCAAEMMIAGRVGLLRTLPPPAARDIAELRRSAAALGIGWPDGAAPGDVVSGVDGASARGAAFLEDAVRLLRGAGYAAFDGVVPAQAEHAGVGARYAHVTAPLRRLADRYATEVCLALHQGHPVPPWARAGLADLPDIMQGSDRRAADLERACTWAVIEFLLADRIGDVFTGSVVQTDSERDRATVLLLDPPVRAHAPVGGLTEGATVRVRLTGLDAESRGVSVEPVVGDSGSDYAVAG